MYKIKLSLILSLLLIQIHLFSQENDSKIGIYENLGHVLSSDIKLTNEASQIVKLSDIVDKPTILVLVYYRCPGICSPLLDGLAEVIRKSDLELEEDYQVLTVSFDARETIDLAIKKKRNYIANIKRKNISSGWKFFTSDSTNISKLCSEVGFKYIKTGNDFTHSASLIVLSPEMKITRYLNGTYFLPFEFKLAIIEASEGKTGPTINKILQYCYSYDPVGGSYILNITKIFGLLLLFIAILTLLILLLKRKNKKTN